MSKISRIALSEEGKALDSEYARRINRGDWGGAYAASATGALQKTFLRIIGRLNTPAVSPTFASWKQH